MFELLCSWGVINVMSLFVLLILCIKGANFSFVNPIFIYNNLKVNWFGAWALAIVSIVLIPVIAIPYWVYKLCTVGR